MIEEGKNKISNSRESFRLHVEAKIDALKNKQISPNNIFDFYNDFLNGLIKISDEVLSKYVKDARVPNKQDREKGLQEDEAFKYFNVNPISETIDSMSNTIEERKQRLEEIIKEISHRSHIDKKVFIPTEKGDKYIITGSENGFEENGYIPRLLTLFYILENDLNLKLEDHQDIKINQGENKKEMMRKESYVRVLIPELNRVVYICNEEANASFVFDEKSIKENNLSALKLDDYSKINFNELIEKNKNIGVKIIQSKNWRERIITALTKDISEFETKKSEIKSDLDSKEKAPLKKEGWESGFSLQKLNDISQNYIENFFENYRKSNPEWFEKQRVRGYTVEHYSPELISIFKKHKEDNSDNFVSELKKEGWKDLTHVSKEFNLQYRTAKALLEKYRNYKDWFKTPIDSKLEFYKKDLIDKIREDMKIKKDYLDNVPFKKNGWELPTNLSVLLNEFGNTVINLANKLGKDNPEWFEEQKDFISNGSKKRLKSNIFYHPDLVKKIIEYVNLKNTKMSNVQERKIGWYNAIDIAKELKKDGIGINSIKKFVEEYRKDHIQWFENQKKPIDKKGRIIYVNYSEHYHPDLVKIIKDHFIKNKE